MDESFIVFRPYEVMLDDFSDLMIDEHTLKEVNDLVYQIATAYFRTGEEFVSNLRRLADIYEEKYLPPGFVSQRLGKYYLSNSERREINSGIQDWR